ERGNGHPAGTSLGQSIAVTHTSASKPLLLPILLTLVHYPAASAFARSRVRAFARSFAAVCLAACGPVFRPRRGALALRADRARNIDPLNARTRERANARTKTRNQ